jgi:hypothetical protein
MLDEECRGASDVTDAIQHACQAREAIALALDKLGWCYGKKNQGGADMRWHKCTKDSLAR